MAWTEINGLRVRYRHYPAAAGVKAKLLMLHMAGSSSVAWSAVARRLGQSAEVFVPDLPGHGQSEGEALDSVAAMAAFAQGFIEQMQLGPVFVAGHSMGGAVALHLALNLADDDKALRGLILVATGARLPVAKKIFSMIDNPQELATMIAGPGLRTQGLSSQVEVIFPQTSATGLRRDFAACSVYDLREQLRQIIFPALVMVGRNDVVTPSNLARELTQVLPKAKMISFDNAGHMLPREQPHWVADNCEKFMKNGLKF